MNDVARLDAFEQIRQPDGRGTLPDRWESWQRFRARAEATNAVRRPRDE